MYISKILKQLWRGFKYDDQGLRIFSGEKYAPKNNFYINFNLKTEYRVATFCAEILKKISSADQCYIEISCTGLTLKQEFP